MRAQVRICFDSNDIPGGRPLSSLPRAVAPTSSA